jgi:hypothetical protein
LANPDEVKPVSIPASANRRVFTQLAAGMPTTSLSQQFHTFISQIEENASQTCRVCNPAFAVRIVSSRSGPNVPRRLRMHTRRVPRSFAISPYDGSACFLVLHDLLEVCLLIARKLPLPIRPVTERPLLFPASSPRKPVGDSCEALSPISRGGERGFHVLI